MNLLFRQHDRGYSWSNEHAYYECSQEEYDELLAKWKEHKNYVKVTWCGREYEHPNHTQVSFGTISATPCTEVSDGFCMRGGREFRAKGITVRSNIGGLQTDYSNYEHYIQPGSIVQNEQVKTESWWA